MEIEESGREEDCLSLCLGLSRSERAVRAVIEVSRIVTDKQAVRLSEHANQRDMRQSASHF